MNGENISNSQKKQATLVIFACWLAYTASYVGRLNYGSSILAIISEFNITKAQAGAASSLFFFCYGAGQLINGILSQRYNTRIAIFISLLCSALFNIAMPLLSSVYYMKYIWAANGFALSVLWSSIIKTLKDYLPDESLPKAIYAMATTVAVGTVFAYLLSSICMGLNNWRLVFYIAAALLVATSFFWYVAIGNSKRGNTDKNQTVINTQNTQPKKSLSFSAIFLGLTIVVAAIANGFVKDGLVLWLPSLLKDNYNVKDYISVLISLALPMTAIFGAFLSRFLWKRYNDGSKALAVAYFASLLILIAVQFVYLKGIILIVVLFAASTFIMAAINNILTSVIPLMQSSGKKSGITAGLINTMCYIGSTLSSFVLAMIFDTRGYATGLITIFLFAAAACLFLAAQLIVKKHISKTVN